MRAPQSSMLKRHSFGIHRKAWGAAHTSEGMRFICTSDAMDDADNHGHWTTLGLWNRWRHETFKNNRDAELQYLDELPASAAAAPAAVATAKAEPEVKKYFEVVATGIHTYGGTGFTRVLRGFCEGFKPLRKPSITLTGLPIGTELDCPIVCLNWMILHLLNWIWLRTGSGCVPLNLNWKYGPEAHTEFSVTLKVHLSCQTDT